MPANFRAAAAHICSAAKVSSPFVALIVNLCSGFAHAQDFDIKFPADLSGHDGSTVGGAETNSSPRPRSTMPNELMLPAEPVSTPSTDPLMEEGSPIPDVLNAAAPEKKGAGIAGKPATVASASELFDAGKKFEDNQEFGRALSSYEDAVKLFRTSRKDAGSSLPAQVAQKYAALLKKLNNPQKAANIEKEFAAAQP